MAKPTRPPLPAVLVANDLLDGEVLFRTAGGWSPALTDALVARDLTAVERLEQAGREAEARQEVVDAYLVEVMRGPTGVHVPRHYRERIKSLGPTHRPDLGKQAVTGQAAGQ